MNERFKLIRKNEGLSQGAFGQKLGVSRDVISNIEYGRVDPKPLLINHLCNTFNINKEWLLTGNGDLYSISNEERELSEILVKLSEKNSKLYPLVSDITKLDDDYFELIESLTEKLLEKQMKQNK